ncbi:hypothetical protein GGS23DRAFT_570864 [Durotheca rogersii]|uniref:uncharacterized protein n=1 Tax=Durotheca rogersii TaxID=419775 RepID=UPI002220642C|nr:uncharacterized protein GGS23DRAFT_570864 [Durotheca rogersii]KAI5862575.1 hypothetical protein GGS23DRAFT_570864 [Durotheca rogersii]
MAGCSGFLLPILTRLAAEWKDDTGAERVASIQHKSGVIRNKLRHPTQNHSLCAHIWVVISTLRVSVGEKPPSCSGCRDRDSPCIDAQAILITLQRCHISSIITCRPFVKLVVVTLLGWHRGNSIQNLLLQDLLNYISPF